MSRKTGSRAPLPEHVVITGASSGIGAALARHYARAGVRLSLHGRDMERLQSVGSACTALGARVNIEAGDVADPIAFKAWLIARDDEHPVDVLIANAGVGGGASMSEAAHEDHEVAMHTIGTNVLGVVNTVAPLLPRFVARRRGRIAIVSSLAGFLGLPDAPAYSASKAAVRTYGHGLRRMVSQSGVRVMVVCPGFVATPMSASLPFRAPFLWSADKAAARIARGIERGSAEVAFPFPLVLALRLSSLLPGRMVDFAVARLRAGNLKPPR